MDSLTVLRLQYFSVKPVIFIMLWNTCYSYIKPLKPRPHDKCVTAAYISSPNKKTQATKQVTSGSSDVLSTLQVWLNFDGLLRVQMRISKWRKKRWAERGWFNGTGGESDLTSTFPQGPWEMVSELWRRAPGAVLAHQHSSPAVTILGQYYTHSPVAQPYCLLISSVRTNEHIHCW